MPSLSNLLTICTKVLENKFYNLNIPWTISRNAFSLGAHAIESGINPLSSPAGVNSPEWLFQKQFEWSRKIDASQWESWRVGLTVRVSVWYIIHFMSQRKNYQRTTWRYTNKKAYAHSLHEYVLIRSMKRAECKC